MDRDRLSSSHDFDPDEVTEHGRGNGRVRELTDPDAYVMLGKLATATARCETMVRELAEESRKDRKAMRAVLRRGTASTVGLIGGIQAVIEILRHAGIIK